jgi:hypothetical protein
MRLNKMGREMFGVGENEGKYVCNGCGSGCGGFNGARSAYQCQNPRCEANIICQECVTGWISKTCRYCGGGATITS